jgi:hypothetical protein
MQNLLREIPHYSFDRISVVVQFYQSIRTFKGDTTQRISKKEFDAVATNLQL